MTTLSDLDTKSKANHGAWLHIKDPRTGELCYSPNGENPLRVKVHGMECDAVKQARIKRDRANMSRDLNNMITHEEYGDTVLEALIIEFDNISDDDGRLLTGSLEDKRKFLNLSDDLNRQIMLFANDRTNFF